jgi:uncharacterized protein (DUF362 family)
MHDWNRREFVKVGAMSLAATAAGRLGWSEKKSVVSLVHVPDGGRDQAIRKSMEIIGLPAVKGRPVVLKPNFNSADRFPGSTHPDTLSSLVRFLRELGADAITVPDRSGMGDTKKVMED